MKKVLIKIIIFNKNHLSKVIIFNKSYTYFATINLIAYNLIQPNL